MNIGSIDAPLTLAEASATVRIKPSHTVWLRGGVYSGDIVCAFTGTEAQPVTIRPYPGEVAVIDGDLTFNGAYQTWLCDHRVIFRWSGWTGRESETNSSAINGRAFDIYTPGVQFRHAIIHDYTSVGFWTDAVGGVFYGCVIYHSGYLGPVRGSGHLLYTQNNTPAKNIKHNLGFNSFGWGIHGYTENGTINNFNFIENTMFNTGALSSLRATYLLGGSVVANTSLWDGNCAYGPGLQFYGKGATDVTFQNNYIPGGVSGTVTYTLNENNVITTPESGTEIRLHADDYSTERAYLTIYNWDEADSVAVDVSAIFDAGDSLKLWAVQAGVDASGVQQDVTDYTVALDGTITVDMRAVTHSAVAVPYEWTAPATTFPEFGCFVVTRV